MRVDDSVLQQLLLQCLGIGATPESGDLQRNCAFEVAILPFLWLPHIDDNCLLGVEVFLDFGERIFGDLDGERPSAEKQRGDERAGEQRGFHNAQEFSIQCVHFFALRGSSAGFTQLMTHGSMP